MAAQEYDFTYAGKGCVLALHLNIRSKGNTPFVVQTEVRYTNITNERNFSQSDSYDKHMHTAFVKVNGLISSPFHPQKG